MVDQQIHHEEILDDVESQKSIYSILANYLNAAEKHGLVVKGYLDGEENYQAFMSEFSAVCRTRFIVRTSWRKDASSLPRKSRYGKEERIYWEYNSGNLEIPFSGTPFVVRSCLTKHCQYGSHYYKTAAEKLSKQCLEEDSALAKIKKRRNKPSKKRECPAIMHIREVVLYPDFSLDLDKLMDFRLRVRQEKSKRLVKLKSALAMQKQQGTSINTLRRFYVSVPLPELHTGHPIPCGGLGPTFLPAVTKKIDGLVENGIYDARHVRVIIHDFVKDLLINSGGGVFPSNVLLFPSENAIADYIYMWSITVKSTVIVESEGPVKESVSQEEIEGSINELKSLIHCCEDPTVLAETKYGMTKLIDSLTNHPVMEISKPTTDQPGIELPTASAKKSTKASKKVQKKCGKPIIWKLKPCQSSPVTNVLPAPEKQLPNANDISPDQQLSNLNNVTLPEQQTSNAIGSSTNPGILPADVSNLHQNSLDAEVYFEFLPHTVDQLDISLPSNNTEFDVLHLGDAS